MSKMNIETQNTSPNTKMQYITAKEQTAVPKTLGDIKIKLQEIIENLVSKEETNTTLVDKINDKFLDLDFGAEFDIDTAKIGVNDAIFFVNLLNSQNIINYTVDSSSITLKASNNKPIEITNSLLKVLENSYTTNKPVRLDFDKDITVIIKLDSQGKVQAHFIPGSAEVESYLKNNIPLLKQRFDDEEINYSYLGYQSKNSKKQKRSNK